jgi:hypothetical protein
MSEVLPALKMSIATIRALMTCGGETFLQNESTHLQTSWNRGQEDNEQQCVFCFFSEILQILNSKYSPLNKLRQCCVSYTLFRVIRVGKIFHWFPHTWKNVHCKAVDSNNIRIRKPLPIHVFTALSVSNPINLQLADSDIQGCNAV